MTDKQFFMENFGPIQFKGYTGLDLNGLNLNPADSEAAALVESYRKISVASNHFATEDEYRAATLKAVQIMIKLVSLGYQGTYLSRS